MAMTTYGDAERQIERLLTGAREQLALAHGKQIGSRRAHWQNAHGFLEAALAQAAAVVATPVKARKLKKLPGPNPKFSNSLQVGLAILALFPDDDTLLGVADMADALGMARATTHRYATTLLRVGQLEQPVGAARKYRRPNIEL
jgi:IclR helix-turn-helix domain